MVAKAAEAGWVDVGVGGYKVEVMAVEVVVCEEAERAGSKQRAPVGFWGGA